jgi:hypothetical protein
MRLWRKRLTDEEYIERVRKQLRIGPWIRFFCLIGAAGLAILLVKMTQVILNNLLNLAPAGQQNNMIGAFAAAASLGMVVGLFATQVIHHLAMSLSQFRTEQLLIECWDKLANHEDREQQIT